MTLNSGTSELTPKNVSFDPETGYLVVQLDKDAYGLSENKILYKGKVFQSKDELHITILSQDAAEAVRIYLVQNKDDLERIERLIRDMDWSYRKKDQYFHVQKSDAIESIIQMVDVPGLDPFFSQLNQILNKKLEKPPTHVTLYTRGDPKGIGLPNSEVFKQLVAGEVKPEQLKPEN